MSSRTTASIAHACNCCGHDRRGHIPTQACPECGDHPGVELPPPRAALRAQALGIASLPLGCLSFGLLWIALGVPAVVMGIACLHRVRLGMGPPTARRPAVMAIGFGALSVAMATLCVGPWLVAVLLRL